MDVDAILARVLQLSASLDDAIEGGRPCHEDAVYALAGLVLELDRWLADGHRAPSRWRAAVGVVAAPTFVLRPAVASNEVTPRRRRPPVRRSRTRDVAGQLALPFATA